MSLLTNFGTIPSQSGIWLSGWTYGKKINIPANSIDADLTNFPLTVYLNNSNFDFTKSASDGRDMRFTDKNLNMLKFERKEHIAYNETINMDILPTSIKNWSLISGTAATTYSVSGGILNIATSAANWYMIGKLFNMVPDKLASVEALFKKNSGTGVDGWGFTLQLNHGDRKSEVNFSNNGTIYYRNTSDSFTSIITGQDFSTYATWKISCSSTSGLKVYKNGVQVGSTVNYSSLIAYISATSASFGTANDSNYSVDSVAISYDSGTLGFASYNVQIPTVTDITDTEVYMWYGNANPPLVQRYQTGVLTAKAYSRTTATTYSTKAQWDALFTGITDTREYTLPNVGIFWKANIDTNPPSAVSPPAPVPSASATYHGWGAEGYIFIPSNGTYSFCVNSDDGAEVIINSTIVSSCYNSRGAQATYELAISTTPFTTVTPIALNRGWYSFSAKMENGAGGYSIAVGWKKPGEILYSTIPASNYGLLKDTYDPHTVYEVYDQNYVMVQHMGTSLVDASGNGNNGVATGTTVVNTDYGKARSFVAGNMIQIGDTIDMGTGNLTIMSLACATTSSDNVLVSKARAVALVGRYWLQYLSTNKLSCYLDPILSSVDCIQTDTLSLGNYYAMCGRWNRNGNEEVLIDGVSKGTTSISAYSATDFNTNVPLRIGAYTSADNTTVVNSWIGTISAVRISNIARSDAWIKAESKALRNELLTITEL